MYKFPHKFIWHIFASHFLCVRHCSLRFGLYFCNMLHVFLSNQNMYKIIYIIYSVTRNRDKSILRVLVGLLNITVLQSVKIVAQKYLLADLINLQLILLVSMAIVFPCIVINYACFKGLFRAKTFSSSFLYFPSPFPSAFRINSQIRMFINLHYSDITTTSK